MTYKSRNLINKFHSGFFSILDLSIIDADIYGHSDLTALNEVALTLGALKVSFHVSKIDN